MTPGNQERAQLEAVSYDLVASVYSLSAASWAGLIRTDIKHLGFMRPLFFVVEPQIAMDCEERQAEKRQSVLVKASNRAVHQIVYRFQVNYRIVIIFGWFAK